MQKEISPAFKVVIALALLAIATVLRVTSMPGDAALIFASYSPVLILCFLFCGQLFGSIASAVTIVAAYMIFTPRYPAIAGGNSGDLTFAFFMIQMLVVGLVIASLRRESFAVRHASLRQKAILENDLLGAAIIRGRRIVWGNRGFERLLGYGPGELVGQPTRTSFPDEGSHRELGAKAYPVLEAGGSFQTELTMVKKDGTRIGVQLSAKMLDADLKESLWLFSDITARKQAEAAALEATAELEIAVADARQMAGRYRLLAENANDVIATMAPDSTVLFVTPTIQRVLGYTPEEIVGQKTLRRTHPDDIPRVIELFTRLMAAGPEAPIEAYEFRALHKSGAWVWLEGQPRIEFSAEGVPVQYQDVVRDINARKLVEAELRTSQSFLARTSRVAGVGGWEYNLVSGKLSWSEETCRLHEVDADYQPTLEEAIGFYDSEAQAVMSSAVQEGIDFGKSWDLKLPIISAKGRKFWARAVGAVEFEGGRATRLVGAFQDVSEVHQLTHDLSESHQLLKVTLKSIADAVVTTDEHGHVTWLNPVAEHLTGWLQAEAAGRPLSQIFVAAPDGDAAQATDPVSACLSSGKTTSIPSGTTLRSCRGLRYSVEGLSSPLYNDGRVLLGAVLIFRDVSDKRRAELDIQHRATHDTLTGLINRAEFETRIGRLLSDGSSSSNHAVLFIDLDEFKLVNDTCGHDIGDQLLCHLGTLMRDSVRSSDSVARLGGDEFGIILHHCDSVQASIIASKICESIDRFRFPHEGKRLRVGSSIGLVAINDQWNSVSAILKAADTACYAAKEGGRNRVHIWVENDRAVEARQGHMQWASRLQTAIDENQFELFGQRIETLAGGSAGLHCEVLLRLRQPGGPLISPGLFLPAAERFHLSTPIDRWVVKEMFRILERDKTRWGKDDRFAINLSGHSMGDQAFIGDLLDAIHSASFDVRVLCFEITETAAITNLVDAKAFIETVRALGVRIALDDFGSGVSSFGYLKNLAVDIIKIDGQFVRHLLDDPLDRVAVRCFVDLAKARNLISVAECVENADVLEALRDMGIDMAQGYLLHKPQRLAELMLSRKDARVVEVSA